jgi:hypothetical protein
VILEASFTLIDDVYSSGITYDCYLRPSLMIVIYTHMFIVKATGTSTYRLIVKVSSKRDHMIMLWDLEPIYFVNLMGGLRPAAFLQWWNTQDRGCE